MGKLPSVKEYGIFDPAHFDTAGCGITWVAYGDGAGSIRYKMGKLPMVQKFSSAHLLHHIMKVEK